MDDYAEEERRIEIRQHAIETRDQAATAACHADGSPTHLNGAIRRGGAARARRA
jgi:hypothetical protein